MTLRCIIDSGASNGFTDRRCHILCAGLQGKDEAVLVLRTHHSIMDGSSLRAAMSDLEALYAALATSKPAGLPALPIQYSDFAQWQHHQQEQGAWEPHVEFWKRHLEGAPAAC